MTQWFFKYIPENERTWFLLSCIENIHKCISAFSRMPIDVNSVKRVSLDFTGELFTTSQLLVLDKYKKHWGTSQNSSSHPLEYRFSEAYKKCIRCTEAWSMRTSENWQQSVSPKGRWNIASDKTNEFLKQNKFVEPKCPASSYPIWVCSSPCGTERRKGRYSTRWFRPHNVYSVLYNSLCLCESNCLH